MSKVKELKAKAAKVADEIRKKADEANADGFKETAEWREAFDKMNGEYNELRSRIDILERADSLAPQDEKRNLDSIRHPAIRQQMSDAQAAHEVRSLALSGWLKAPRNLASDDEIRAMQELRIDPRGAFEINVQPTLEARSLQRIYHEGHPAGFERRAMSAVTGAGGGYTVAEGFVPRLEVALLQFGPMLAVSEILRTASGEALPWPTIDDTSNEAEEAAELADANQEDIAFGRLVLNAYKYSSKFVEVPVELLQDSALDVQGIVGQMLGERLGRILNTRFTTADGSSKPNGVHNAATAASAAATSTTVADQLIDLIHSVESAYRLNGRFMAADLTIAEVRKLKDSDGNYLWQSGIQAGRPDSLLGYPISVNNDLSAPSGSPLTAPVLFGDFSKYKVRMVQGIRLERDRDIKRDSEIFIAYVRADGDLLDAGTKPIKKMTLSW